MLPLGHIFLYSLCFLAVQRVALQRRMVTVQTELFGPIRCKVVVCFLISHFEYVHLNPLEHTLPPNTPLSPYLPSPYRPSFIFLFCLFDPPPPSSPPAFFLNLFAPLLGGSTLNTPNRCCCFSIPQVATLDGRVVSGKPEYDDCAAAVRRQQQTAPSPSGQQGAAATTAAIPPHFSLAQVQQAASEALSKAVGLP